MNDKQPVIQVGHAVNVHSIAVVAATMNGPAVIAMAMYGKNVPTDEVVLAVVRQHYQLDPYGRNIIMRAGVTQIMSLGRVMSVTHYNLDGSTIDRHDVIQPIMASVHIEKKGNP